MTKRVLIVDTGVFLHCQFFDQLDWHKWMSAKEVTLALCPTVVGQLDSKKHSRESARIRDRAKGVIKKIESIISDDTPVQFRNGCWLWAITHEPRIDMAAYSLTRASSDDVIIASALEQKEAGADVTLVAIDLGIRLKAASRGLHALAPKSEWMLPDEPDELERRFRELQKEHAEILAAAPDLRLTSAGDTVVTIRAARTAPLTSTQIENHIAFLRKKHKTLARPDSLAMGVIMGADVQHYNTGLERYFDQMRDYLSRHREAHERRDRTTEVAISLENNGKLVAEDVDVIITADAPGRWRDEKPPLTIQAPEPPRMPLALFDPSSMLRSIVPLSERERPNVITRTLTRDRPTVSRYHVNRVKVDLPVQLPVRHFEFESFELMQSFTLRYRLVAKNLMRPKEGDLHIRIVGDEVE